jgi:hypothetical protein
VRAVGAMVGFWFFTTQFQQGVLGFGPAQAGMAFLPATLPNFAAALAVPKHTKRLGIDDAKDQFCWDPRNTLVKRWLGTLANPAMKKPSEMKMKAIPTCMVILGGASCVRDLSGWGVLAPSGRCAGGAHCGAQSACGDATQNRSA